MFENRDKQKRVSFLKQKRGARKDSIIQKTEGDLSCWLRRYEAKINVPLVKSCV